MLMAAVAATLGIWGIGWSAQDQRAPGQAAPAELPRASDLVSKCLARYSDCKTMTGTIRMVQQAGETRVAIETVLQYEKPSKLYVMQTKYAGESWKWAITSNGEQFSYNAPLELPPHDPRIRLVEPVKSGNKVLDVRDIFAVGSSTLGDAGFPLVAVLGTPPAVRRALDEWAGMQTTDRTRVGEQDAYVIVGQWRDGAKAQPTGRFRLVIGTEGDLFSYEKEETVSFHPDLAPMVVRTEWSVRVQPNGTVNPALFRVIR